MSAVQTSSVSFHNTCDVGVQVVVFMPPVACCWKLAAVDWSYGDESLDLHLHGVPLTGIRLSRREKLVETDVKYRRVRLCVVNALTDVSQVVPSAPRPRNQ